MPSVPHNIARRTTGFTPTVSAANQRNSPIRQFAIVIFRRSGALVIIGAALGRETCVELKATSIRAGVALSECKAPRLLTILTTLKSCFARDDGGGLWIFPSDLQ